MALWGNNDNVSALGESGAGVVTLDYDTLTVTGTGSSFGTPGYAKTGDVIRIGMTTDSGTYFGDPILKSGFIFGDGFCKGTWRV